VRALLERTDGARWVGTSEGLFRGRDERFERIGPAELVGVRCVLEDPVSGTVWVGTETGLARLEGSTLRCYGVSGWRATATSRRVTTS